MDQYSLPYSVEIGGEEYEIRADFRPIFDIIDIIDDPRISSKDAHMMALEIFYPKLFEIPMEYLGDAIREMGKFLRCGEDDDEDREKEPQKTEGRKQRKLINFSKDFPFFVGPVNEFVGFDVRSTKYDPIENKCGFHYWTLQTALMNIKECTYTQILSIRIKLSEKKPLTKEEKKFLSKHREWVIIDTIYTDEENERLRKWGA